MVNLRERVEQDLSFSLEGTDWGLPVQLVAPDGTVQIFKKDSTEDLLMGQVLYETIRVNPDSGEEIVVREPVVTLRRTSLNRIPAEGEKWAVKIPEKPSLTANLITYLLDESRPPEGGEAIGFIRLYLIEAGQV